MAGNAFIGVEVQCGTSAPGLDGSKNATWVFSFEFPDGEACVFYIPVVADKNKPEGEHGDTGGDVVDRAKAAVQKAVKSGKLSAKNAAHIGFEKNEEQKGTKGGKPITNYLGRISFSEVSSVDAASTDGKVRSRAFVNPAPAGVAGLPEDGVEVKDPPDPPKGTRWEQTMKEQDNESEWEKWVHSGGWGKVAYGHYTVRLQPPGQVAVYDDGDDDRKPWGKWGKVIRVPFAYVHSSKGHQVNEMRARLERAGFECAYGPTWVRPVRHGPTGLAVAGYGIETAADPFNIYGPFPWTLVLGVIRRRDRHQAVQRDSTERPMGPARPPHQGDYPMPPMLADTLVEARPVDIRPPPLMPIHRPGIHGAGTPSVDVRHGADSIETPRNEPVPGDQPAESRSSDEAG